jgi:hypothetical protein
MLKLHVFNVHLETVINVLNVKKGFIWVLTKNVFPVVITAFNASNRPNVPNANPATSYRRYQDCTDNVKLATLCAKHAKAFQRSV